MHVKNSVARLFFLCLGACFGAAVFFGAEVLAHSNKEAYQPHGTTAERNTLYGASCPVDTFGTALVWNNTDVPSTPVRQSCINGVWHNEAPVDVDAVTIWDAGVVYSDPALVTAGGIIYRAIVPATTAAAAPGATPAQWSVVGPYVQPALATAAELTVGTQAARRALSPLLLRGEIDSRSPLSSWTAVSPSRAEILNKPDLNAVIFAYLSANSSGTVFPSPSYVGQNFLRTDLGATFSWNGTAWLGAPEALVFSAPGNFDNEFARIGNAQVEVGGGYTRNYPVRLVAVYADWINTVANAKAIELRNGNTVLGSFNIQGAGPLAQTFSLNYPASANILVFAANAGSNPTETVMTLIVRRLP